MANLKEIRTRIASIRTTKQVTAAMKMVAASRLKRAQDAILCIRPYSARLYDMLLTAMQEHAEAEEADFSSPYLEVREPRRTLAVLITSNRGLCGSFNAAICRASIELTMQECGAVPDAFFAIGKHAERFVKARGFTLAGEANALHDGLHFAAVSTLAEQLMQEFVAEKWDRVMLIYNQFKNVSTQTPLMEQFLPVELPDVPVDLTGIQPNYIMEPSSSALLGQIIPLSLKVQLFKALTDSTAAEHAARMKAMHQATDNAEELLRDLTVAFNKARQSSITNEIIEVTGGAEALKQ
ncbi:MAG: ATP synthase F1 subunit gamma [Bacteroidales bacterium]|jgi:F-type H+-transporting ATPase subunit gamma|nr:ATP synthase F1 subunit gamma [Bacteroidales bacterium]